MADAENSTAEEISPDDSSSILSQALLRVTEPGNAVLRRNLEALRQELLSIADAIHQAEEQFQQRDESLAQRDEELSSLLQALSQRQELLEENLRRLEEKSREQLKIETGALQSDIESLNKNLVDPERNAERMAPVVVPVLHKQAREDSFRFGEAVAPVIGPAIRHQIREAKQDIIDALYPLIGQIIGKAISEAIRELTRSIDARIRQQKSLRSQLSHFYARLKGVSEAEITLREALPYQIHRIFLVHRKSGLLLEHLSAKEEIEPEDLNIISSMLTAIRDFVHDAFIDRQGELEEIQYGDQRILLEAGQNAYLAVALTGVEPQGYHQLIQNAVIKINIDYEKEIRGFCGDVQTLPNFRPDLLPILFPETKLANSNETRKLSRTQKVAVTAGVLGILFFLVLLSFACLFTVRLWPLVFK